MNLPFYQYISLQIIGAIQAALSLRSALLFSRHGIAQELLHAGWTSGERREILVCSGLSGGIASQGTSGAGDNKQC